MERKEQSARMFDTGTVVMCLLFVVCIALFALTGGDRLRWLPKPLFVFFRMASIVGILGILAYFIGESLPRSIYDQ